MKKYIATGNLIDIAIEFATEQEAKEQIRRWVEEDKQEFPEEDTENEYYIEEVEA